MGRLENFIPLCRKLTFEERKGKLYVFAPGVQAFATTPRLQPFLKCINGHLSLQEIMLLLNSRDQRLNFKESLGCVEKLAERGFLVNSADFLKIYHTPQGHEQFGAKVNPMHTNFSATYFSRERLVGLLQKTTLFLRCDRQTAEKILNSSTLEHHPENTRIIKMGTRSRHFFIMLAGEVGVFKRGNLLANLGTLAVFGESAAIFDRDRNADVSTTTSSWLLKIDATKLVDVKTQEDQFDFLTSLKSRLILNQTMASNALFRDVPSDILQLFLSKCRIEKYAKESIIIRQGDTHGQFYFILRGSVVVVKDGIPVTSLAEGEHFGEVAAIFREPRTASIITESACVFLTMSRQALMEVLCSHFRLAIDVEKTAAARKVSNENVFTKLSQDLSASGLFAPNTFNGQLSIDDEFIEITESNFNMKVIDFTKNSGQFELADPDQDEDKAS